MQPQDILDRYRHLRAISTRHHSGALDHLARPAILGRAKDLGLADGSAIVAGSEEEMTLIFDLAIHTVRQGRSRAIDRYAKVVALPAGTDEARVLEAMRQAKFSIWRIERHHDAAGLIVLDVLRGGETWLVDEGLTVSAEPGMAFASRLFWPADFAVTCGIVVPIDVEILQEALFGANWLRYDALGKAADDPRLATALYRGAIEAGMMDDIEFREPGIAA